MIGHIEGNDKIHTVSPPLNTPFQEKLYGLPCMPSYSLSPWEKNLVTVVHPDNLQ